MMIITETSVKSSANYISRNSSHVKISLKEIASLASEIKEWTSKENYNSSIWKTHPLHPKKEVLSPKEIVNWIFIVDLLNFSFWTEKENSYAIEYQGNEYTGYWSLCAAINRALDSGIPITNPNWYGNISTDEELIKVFKSHGKNKNKNDENKSDKFEMPMLKERIQILRQAGQKLASKYENSFVNCLKEANYNVINLLNLIIVEFPSFFDASWYNRKNGENENQEIRTKFENSENCVFFLKRAQILIADIWACFEGKDYGALDGIEHLTAFADYRIPQILESKGVLIYDKFLKQALKSPIPSGSIMEMEIRANAIEAIEQIKAIVPNLNSILIDFFLWDHFNDFVEKEDKKHSFHKTRSIYY